MRSQFANGWNSTDKATRKLTSQGFSPAYFTLAAGFTYVCPLEKFPIKINVSPISMNATYVTSSEIREYFYNDKFGGTGIAFADYKQLDATNQNTPYAYGLTLANGVQRYEGGSSIQIDFDKTFGKKGIFRYRTTFYSFYGWINEVSQQKQSKEWNSKPENANDPLHFESIAPTIRWESTIDIKATKYFSTQFYFQLYYNKAQINKIQTQVVLGVGLAYTFKNK